MNRIRTILAIAVAIHCAAATSWGCAFCFVGNPLQPTLTDEVTAAQDVAVASATGKPDTFEIQSVIKGDVALKGGRVSAPGIEHTGRLILSRTAADAPWKCLGSSGVQLAGFLKVVLTLPATPPANDAEWNERLAHFRPFLAHPDPRLARSALMEWARAPYLVLKAQHVDGEKLSAWLINPQQADPQQMMNVVLGAFGDAGDAGQINEYVKAGRLMSAPTPPTP